LINSSYPFKYDKYIGNYSKVNLVLVIASVGQGKRGHHIYAGVKDV